MRNVLRDILENDGCAVVAVGDGKTALEEIQQRNFDIAIVDYVLPPPHTGLALIRRLREQDPEIVPILITGYHISELAELASHEKVFRYITKPIDRSWLCSCVASALWIKGLKGIRDSSNRG